MRRLLPPSTLHASSTSSGVEAKQSCPADLGLWGRSLVKAHVAAVRGLPSFSEVGHAGGLRGFRGSHCGRRWSAGRGSGCLRDSTMVLLLWRRWCFFPWSFQHFFLRRLKTVETREERMEGKARSRAAVRARGRRGKDPKEHERSDVGGVDPTISPSPEFPGSARLDLGGTCYRALLIVVQTLITQPPWRVSSLFDDDDTTLWKLNCATTKSPCYRATLSAAPHKSRNLPKATFLMVYIFIVPIEAVQHM